MQVKVWNDNTYPFRQDIAGNVYSIPAKSFVEMDEEEADRLVKAFSPIKVDYDGNALPQSYKMLRIDADDLKRARSKRDNRAKSGSYVCQACGYVAANKWELNGHTLELHKGELEDPMEAAEAIVKEQQEEEGKKRKRG